MTDFAAIRHLLIDLDGTLLGNRELPLRLDFAFRALYSLKRHGGWIKAVKTLRAIYFELDQVPVEIKQGLTNDKRAVAAFAKAVGLPITDAAQILTKSVAELFPLLKRHFYPIPGAKEFLNWAKDHYPLTLATNPVWPEELVVLRLEWAGIDPSIFKNITHAGIMHACKPASEYYREILKMISPDEKIGASQFLLVGDDKSKDLPATRVGIPVFILSKVPAVTMLPTPSGYAEGWTGSFEMLKAKLEGRS